MYQTEQQKLSGDFLLASKREVVHAFLVADVTEYRLNCANPFPVFCPSSRSINLLTHLVDHSRALFGLLLMEEDDLPWALLICALKAPSSQRTFTAIRYPRHEGSAPEATEVRICALEIERVTGRAGAGQLLRVEFKIGGNKALWLSRCFLWLVVVGVGKPWIAFAVLIVGNVAIAKVVIQEFQVVCAKKSGVCTQFRLA